MVIAAASGSMSVNEVTSDAGHCKSGMWILRTCRVPKRRKEQMMASVAATHTSTHPAEQPEPGHERRRTG